MDTINFPILSGDWFAPAIIALVGAVLAGIISQVVENKISTKRAIVFSGGTIAVALGVILFWYNLIGIIIFSNAQDIRESKGCLAAFPYYKNATKWNPKIANARWQMVVCGLELNRNDEVLAILEPLESVLQDHWHYWVELSWAYYGSAKYTQMIKAVENGADLNPSQTEWIAVLGEKLMRNFNYSDAEAVLRVSRTRNDADGISTFWLAWALYEQRKYDDALFHFDECIRLNTSGYKLSRCIAGKGFVYKSIGQYGEAKSLFETSLKMDPNQNDVKEALEAIP